MHDAQSNSKFQNYTFPFLNVLSVSSKQFCLMCQVAVVHKAGEVCISSTILYYVYHIMHTNSHGANSPPAVEHWNCTVSSLPGTVKHSPLNVTAVLLLAAGIEERWITGLQRLSRSMVNLKRREPSDSFRFPITSSSYWPDDRFFR